VGSVASNQALGKVFFWVRDNELIVANTGQPFDAKGVISICRLNLSSKDSEIEDIENVEKEGVKFIKEKAIERYKNDKNDLREHINAEKEVLKDYAGRFVWELLQNADDANVDRSSSKKEYIGEKGLGFKSVLEITEEPYIYSGKFNFYFSKKATRDLLIERLNLNDSLKEELIRNGLTFRIPHEIKNEEIPEFVKKLHNKGYSTVIVLPFKDNRTKDRAIKVLQEIND